MTAAVPEGTVALSFYIDYEYLAAQQLGDLLLGLHGVFDDLLYADEPYLRQLPSAPAARLRIQAIETGNSMTVYLVHGVTQLVGAADPALVSVASGAATLTATGMLILRLLHRAEDLRGKYLRDSRADEQAQLDLADKRLDLARKSLELRAATAELEQRQLRVEDVKTILAKQDPNRQPEQRSALAEQLMPSLELIVRTIDSDNIRSARITLPEPGPGPGPDG
jgi:hypothetical protein